MALLRFSRDKRGYEHFYLIEPGQSGRGKGRSRVLYWFRTPPNIRVGREPFDADARRALEARYPEVAFDWQKLVETPIPPPGPDVERWRERRRAERAEKQAAREEAASEDQPLAEMTGAGAPSEPEDLTPEAELPSDDGGGAAEENRAAGESGPTSNVRTGNLRTDSTPTARHGHRRRRRRARNRAAGPTGN